MANGGKSTANAEVVDSGEIEGGFVGNIEDMSFQPEKHHADTSRWLAVILISVLVASVVGHYWFSIYLRVTGFKDVAESTGRIFEVWLPIISSLASSAVTFFFTREK